MSRRALALAALACSFLLAGCGVNHHDIVASTVISTPSTAEVPDAQTTPADVKAIRRVTIVVLDELSSAPIGDAIVTLGRQSATTDAKGVATFPRLAALPLRRRGARRRATTRSATASACAPPAASPSCACGGRAGRGRSTARDAARTQSPAGINLTPHLRLRWGLKLDGLVEFPPVTAQGIGYVTTAKGTVTAFETDTGKVVWRRPLERAHGRVARRRRRARLRRLVRGPDPRARRARRAPAVAEGARRRQRELAAGRARPPAVRRGRRARAGARSRDGEASLDRRRRRQGDDGRDRRQRARDRRRLRRPRARAQRAHRPPALGRQGRRPAVRRHLVAGRPAVRRELDRQEPDRAAPRQRQADLAGVAARLRLLGPGGRGQRRRRGQLRRAPARVPRDRRVAALGRRHGRQDLRDAADRGAASSGQRASPATPTRSALASGTRLQRFGHGRYAGTAGDAHTLFLLGFSRIWGLR